MLTIDGVIYDVKIEVTRTSVLTASDISGLLLNKHYFFDVIGTYMQYDVTFKYPLFDQAKYAAIYEVLNAPVSGHTFVLPYNQGTLTVNARVESVSDRWKEMDSGRTYWENATFTIIANEPSKV